MDEDLMIERGQRALAAASDDDPNRLQYLEVLFALYADRSNGEHHEPNLDNAITYGEQLAAILPPGYANARLLFQHLPELVMVRYQSTRSIVDLGAAIHYKQQLLEFIPVGSLDYKSCLYGLGQMIRARFRHSNDIDDLSLAIEHFSKSLVPGTKDPNRLKVLAVCLSERFRRKPTIEDLQQAIEFQLQIIELSTEDVSSKSIWLRELAWHLHWRFQQLGDPDDMTNSLFHFEKALETSAVQDVHYPMMLHDLGVAHRSMFSQSGDMCHLERARDCRTKALAIAPAKHVHRASLLNGLAGILSDLFEHTNDAILLEDAIRYGYEAIETAEELPVDQSSLASIFNNLGKAKYQQARLQGSPESLDEAISLCNQAVDLVPKTGLEYILCLINLGASYSHRYFQRGARKDLDIGIDYLQTALDGMSKAHHLRPECLLSLSLALSRRFNLQGGLSDFEQSIEYAEGGLKSIHEDHAMRSNLLSNLGVLLCSRFGRSNDSEDRKRGIAYCQEAVTRTQGTCPNYAIHLTSLGLAYQEVFERTYEVADATDAVLCLEQACRNVGDDPARQAEYLKNLSSIWISRYELTGDPNDIQQAIEHGEKAVKTGTSTARLDLSILNILSTAFDYRFHRLGQMSDLSAAIRFDQKALSLTENNIHFRLVYLNNLARSLCERYLVSWRMMDLDAAIRLSEQVFTEATENHIFYVQFQQTMGYLLHVKFLRTGKIQDLEKSICCVRNCLQSIEALSNEHPSRPAYLDALGTTLAARFRLLKQNADIESAIKHGRQAVEFTPKENHNCAFRMHNLACHMEDLFQSTKSMDDLAESITLNQRAVDSSPKNHPLRVTLLSYLGAILRQGSDMMKMDDLFSRSTEAFTEGLSCSHGLPLGRLFCGINAVFNLGKIKRWNDAAVVLDQTLDIIPDIVPGTISKGDMQILVQKFFGFGGHAASIFLKVGRTPLQALQALESCRGIIASLVMDSRPDLSNLQSNQPELCARYTKCLNEISSMNSTISGLDPGYVEAIGGVISLYEALNEMRQEIRGQPGLERFLLPLSQKEILGMAEQGPIVSLSVSDISAEAFLLTSTGVEALPLPDVDIDTVLGLLRTFQSHGNRARRDADIVFDNEDDTETSTGYTSVPPMDDALGYIWRLIVKPVIQKLQLLRNETCHPSLLTRIWWISGGVLSLMPLHAAGHHEPESMENTISHVISSYATTLKSLQFLRKKDQMRLVDQKHEVLVISMPTTPGTFYPLDVRKEVDAIKTFAEPWANVTALERPGKSEVIEALQRCTIAHFACHGMADPVDPMKSNLLLGRNELEKLSIEDFDKMTFEKASIIYLSACSTAELKVRDLADESLHLASSFQLAGFQHVIATVWGAKDRAAVEVAKSFYEALHKATDIGAVNVAEALHIAVVSLRNTDENWKDISLWGPFVHLGT